MFTPLFFHQTDQGLEAIGNVKALSRRIRCHQSPIPNLLAHEMFNDSFPGNINPLF
jgi:hypothetical protein